MRISTKYIVHIYYLEILELGIFFPFTDTWLDLRAVSWNQVQVLFSLKACKSREEDKWRTYGDRNVTKTKGFFFSWWYAWFKMFQNKNASWWMGMFHIFNTEIKPPRRSIYITRKCDCLVVQHLNIYEVYSFHMAFP